MNTVARELGVSTCSYDEWIEKLEVQASVMVEMEEAELLPALKSMDFFRSLKSSLNETPVASTYVEGKGVRESGRMREAASITENDIHQWVKYWKEVGLL